MDVDVPPVPHRILPPHPGSRPTSMSTQNESPPVPSRPPSSGQKSASVKASLAQVQNGRVGGTGAGARRVRPVITVVDARPMNEVGFRGERPASATSEPKQPAEVQPRPPSQVDYVDAPSSDAGGATSGGHRQEPIGISSEAIARPAVPRRPAAHRQSLPVQALSSEGRKPFDAGKPLPVPDKPRPASILHFPSASKSPPPKPARVGSADERDGLLGNTGFVNDGFEISASQPSNPDRQQISSLPDHDLLLDFDCEVAQPESSSSLSHQTESLHVPGQPDSHDQLTAMDLLARISSPDGVAPPRALIGQLEESRSYSGGYPSSGVGLGARAPTLGGGGVPPAIPPRTIPTEAGRCNIAESPQPPTPSPRHLDALGRQDPEGSPASDHSDDKSNSSVIGHVDTSLWTQADVGARESLVGKRLRGFSPPDGGVAVLPQMRQLVPPRKSQSQPEKLSTAATDADAPVPWAKAKQTPGVMPKPKPALKPKPPPASSKPSISPPRGSSQVVDSGAGRSVSPSAEVEAHSRDTVSAMRARLEQDIGTGSSASVTTAIVPSYKPKAGPVKATYRPTIIRPSKVSGVANTPSSTSTDGHWSSEMDSWKPEPIARHSIKTSAGDPKRKPTIIRPRSTLNLTDKEEPEEKLAAEAQAAEPQQRKKRLSNLAISMPNLTRLTEPPGPQHQEAHMLSENTVNDILETDRKISGHHKPPGAIQVLPVATKPLPASRTDDSSSALAAGATPWSRDDRETSAVAPVQVLPTPARRCSEPQAAARKPPPARPPPAKAAPPRPSAAPKRSPPPAGPRGREPSSIDSKPPPPRPSAPPNLPKRPGPGHPLFHYVVQGPHGIALYDYDASQPDELTFKAGDVLVLKHRVDDQWLVGQCAGREGMFPASFVDVVEPPPDQPQGSASKTRSMPRQPSVVDVVDSGTGPRCLARFDYEGGEVDDLPFSEGAIIRLIEWVGDEWLKGELRGRSGMFPADYVEILEDLPKGSMVIQEEHKDNNIVTAMYDFSGEEGELSFQAGDTIMVLSQQDADWLHGEVGYMQGTFPAAFVDRVPGNLPQKAPTSSVAEKSAPGNTRSSEQEAPKQAFCVATFDYAGGDADDLSFSIGDRIEVKEILDADWMMGSLRGKEGMFPSAYIEVCSETDDLPPRPGMMSSSTRPNQTSATSSAASKPNTSPQPCAQVLYDFQGQSSDDLSFTVGDKIDLVAQVDSEWMRGRLGSREGLFPANFVNVIVPL